MANRKIFYPKDGLFPSTKCFPIIQAEHVSAVHPLRRSCFYPLCNLLCLNRWPGGQLPEVSGAEAIRLRLKALASTVPLWELSFTHMTLSTQFTGQHVIYLHLTKRTQWTTALRVFCMCFQVILLLREFPILILILSKI